MKIEIQATAEQLDQLINALTKYPEMENIKQQIVTAINLEKHNPSAEVPSAGDHEVIERSE